VLKGGVVREIILISISGGDQMGVTVSVTEILANHKVNVLDIGQANIHDTLSLGMLVELPKEAESAPLLKDILFRIHELGLDVWFKPISEEEYGEWVAQQGKPKNIVTLLARKITAEHLAGLTAIVLRHELNVDRIDRRSGRIALDESLDKTKACIEFSVRGELKNPAQFRSELMTLSRDQNIDIAFQVDNVFRRNRRLIVFDMDSTLIEVEVIDELARVAGVGEEVAAITEQAMHGELDFKQSFRKRVALLKGMDEQVLKQVAEKIPLSEGAERLISNIKKIGLRTAILSGGFTYFGKMLQEKLGIDYVFANELEFADGKVTGNVVGDVVDGQRKADLLRMLAEKEQISLQQVIAVGDGANDLPMLNIAGLGVAFRAKPIVKQSAQHSISNLGLDGILYLIGFSDKDTGG
jgi:phosphoserine phosphatase